MLRLNLLTKKCFFSIVIIATIILGYQIPVAGLGFFGGHLEEGADTSLVLFALGLSPWMASQLLWRVLTLGDRKPYTKKRQTKMQLTMLLIALIQSLAMTLQSTSLGEFLSVSLPLSIILIAASYVVALLANLNAQYGIGGVTLVFLTNILLSKEDLGFDLSLLTERHNLVFLGLLVAWSFLSVFGMVILERAEYRVKIRRLGLNNDFANDSYLPFKLNFSSGMPFMYAFTLLAFPKYLFTLLNILSGKSIDFSNALTYFTINHWKGALVYMAILLSLNLIFTMFNGDVVNTVETMRSQGDYIIGIAPGNDTKQYLTTLLWRLGMISGISIALLAGLPILLAQLDTEMADLATLPTIIMMIASMMMTVIQEVSIIQLVRGYHQIVDYPEDS